MFVSLFSRDQPLSLIFLERGDQLLSLIFLERGKLMIIIEGERTKEQQTVES